MTIKRALAMTGAAVLLAGCDPVFTDEELATITATETVVTTATATVTIDPTDDMVTVTEPMFPSEVQTGPSGDIGAYYATNLFNAQVTECYVAEEGVVVKYNVQNGNDFTADVQGQVAVFDNDSGVRVGYGGMMVQGVKPLTIAEGKTYIHGVDDLDNFICTIEVMEAVNPDLYVEFPDDGPEPSEMWPAPTSVDN